MVRLIYSRWLRTKRTPFRVMWLGSPIIFGSLFGAYLRMNDILMGQLIQSHLPFMLVLVSKILLRHVWIVGKKFSLPFLLFGQQILELTSLVVNLVRISYCQKYHQIRLLKVVSVVSYLQSLWLLSLV